MELKASGIRLESIKQSSEPDVNPRYRIHNPLSTQQQTCRPNLINKIGHRYVNTVKVIIPVSYVDHAVTVTGHTMTMHVRKEGRGETPIPFPTTGLREWELDRPQLNKRII